MKIDDRYLEDPCGPGFGLPARQPQHGGDRRENIRQGHPQPWQQERRAHQYPESAWQVCGGDGARGRYPERDSGLSHRVADRRLCSFGRGCGLRKPSGGRRRCRHGAQLAGLFRVQRRQGRPYGRGRDVHDQLGHGADQPRRLRPDHRSDSLCFPGHDVRCDILRGHFIHTRFWKHLLLPFYSRP